MVDLGCWLDGSYRVDAGVGDGDDAPANESTDD
jgi:endogenous inhibitor of DNA gyrase (YacG/DUF329 family)